MLHRPLIQRAGGFVPPIEQSLIFDGAAYLSRTPGSAGNRKTWTWAGWVRRSAFGTLQQIFGQGVGVSGGGLSAYFSSDTIRVYSGSADYFISTSVLRDPGWYHIAVVCDTSNATTADRIRVYQNGVRLTNGAGVMPALNTDTLFNQAVEHRISGTTGGSFLFSGALADIHFIDGTAITDIAGTFLQDWAFDGQSIPTPKAVSGLTYGTNGFHLAFVDTAAFGDDTSGNGNDWTPTGFVATDQTADVPGRPYAIINPILPGIAAGDTRDGGLQIVQSAGGLRTYLSSFPIPSSGKSRFRYQAVSGMGGGGRAVGILDYNYQSLTSGLTSLTGGAWSYDGATGQRFINGSGAAFGSSWTNGADIEAVYDADAGTLEFYLGGVSQGTISSVTGNNLYFAVGTENGGTFQVDFGQRGYTTNDATALPLSVGSFETPLHAGGNWFDANLRAGTNADASITSLSFRPDLLWSKDRNAGSNHRLFDVLRDPQLGDNELCSNTTGAEGASASLGITFDANGYSLDVDVGSNDEPNTTGVNYVDWLWKAGGAGVANTDGTISSTVSVADAGHFSIVTWTGTGANATVGHGLPGAAEMVIVKRRDTTGNWPTQHPAIVAANSLYLNTTAATAAATTVWNSTKPTSTVFSTGTSTDVNASGGTYIAYCFRSVPGLCKVGSYTGNGSADGPLIWLGFTSRWVMIKRVDGTGDWWIYDTARRTFNPNFAWLVANGTSAENAGDTRTFDILGDGFKARRADADMNASGGTYIYLAMADIAGGGDLPWPLAR